MPGALEVFHGYFLNKWMGTGSLFVFSAVFSMPRAQLGTQYVLNQYLLNEWVEYLSGNDIVCS